MKIILLLFLTVCSIISTESRLIEKNTDRTLTTEAKAGTSPPIRLARQVFGDYSLVGLSNDNEDSQEFIPNYNRKVRHFFTGSSKTNPPGQLRKRRDSNERIDTPVKTLKSSTPPSVTASSTHARVKPKSVLVKKPIPKYNEIDYDEDFQMKIVKSPVKLLDSGEHEDEDFNVDDYDFDVNHDEFIGRGKPLEPRMKHKDYIAKPITEVKVATAPDIKIKSKVNVHTVSTKKERSTETQRKAIEKDDYYDDSTSTTKAPQKPRELDDEFNEDNEESKEFDSKASNVRLARSPWDVNGLVEKFGDKASSIMTKILSILPMFPQVPNSGTDFEYTVGNGHTNVQGQDAWSNRGNI